MLPLLLLSLSLPPTNCPPQFASLLISQRRLFEPQREARRIWDSEIVSRNGGFSISPFLTLRIGAGAAAAAAADKQLNVNNVLRHALTWHGNLCDSCRDLASLGPVDCSDSLAWFFFAFFLAHYFSQWITKGKLSVWECVCVSLFLEQALPFSCRNRNRNFCFAFACFFWPSLLLSFQLLLLLLCAASWSLLSWAWGYWRLCTMWNTFENMFQLGSDTIACWRCSIGIEKNYTQWLC